MLIDDDEPTNFVNTTVIKKANCAEAVKICQTGDEALEYLKSDNKQFPKPDLILLDISMPGMNGWDFLDEYAKLPKEQQAQAAVVMLATSLNKSDKIKADQMPQVAGLQPKPLTQEVLLNMLKQHFPHFF